MAGVGVIERDDGVEVVATEEFVETKTQLMLLVSMMDIVGTDELTEFIQSCERVHTLMPIFDPTGYMKVGDNATQLGRIAAAVRTCKCEINKVLEGK
jgi:hypothetical protein